MATISTMKNATIARMGMVLYLDLDNAPDEIISHQDHAHGGQYHDLSILVFRHALQIAGGHEHERHRRQKRQDGQDSGGQPAMRAGRFHLSLEPESFANHVRQAAQNLVEVASRLALQHDRRSEKLEI